ncbi:multiple sugar transport system permease protein [Thermosporothrix hazakensis]|jgi:multiple sugar transport system permease protein|uniref:Multiple sugar transport system permease protein n=1 Tax=Thermosporothrix hazakensis TaxID=644383 RepID=A0A326U5D9_THEHA|nr:sugar ABC transporter permease [Thermosporothrix hazakensis]PZW28492.1 multiple sugar transport system permease protein [Thermosporothrix hazakensis]GCE45267.1 sugar ABC transporter permease [Thermosporothrix hazakensis]
MDVQLHGKAVAEKQRRGWSQKEKKEVFWGYTFILPQLLGMLVFSIFPLISVFVLSLTQWDGLGDIHFVGFQNFIDQFTGEDLRIALARTVYYTVLTVPIGLFIALMLSLALNNVRGKSFYRLLYFMPYVTGSVAVGVIWSWLLNSDLGLINNLLKGWFHIDGIGWLTDSRYVIPSLAMVGIWQGLGFNIVLFLAGLQGIPQTYFEAARIDGANRFQTFWRVTLPLLTPTIFFTTVISVINSFQVFDLTFILTDGGPGKDSYTMVYHIYNLGFKSSQYGSASAVAVILFLILMVLTLIQFRLQRRWVHYEM